MRWLSDRFPDDEDTWILRRDRAARAFSDMASTWLTKGPQASVSNARMRLLEQLSQTPPNHPGCGSCPVRCLLCEQAEPLVATTGKAVTTRAVAPGDPQERLDLVRKITAGLVPGASPEALAYCLIINTLAVDTRLTPEEREKATGFATSLRERVLS